MGVDGEVTKEEEDQDEEMVKEGVHRRGKDRVEVRTRLDALVAVLSLLSLGLRLHNGILKVSCGALHVKDKLFSILHDILDGEIQLKIWTGISTGNQTQDTRAGTSSRTPTFPMGILIVPVLSPLHSVVP